MRNPFRPMSYAGVRLATLPVAMVATLVVFTVSEVRGQCNEGSAGGSMKVPMANGQRVAMVVVNGGGGGSEKAIRSAVPVSQAESFDEYQVTGPDRAREDHVNTGQLVTGVYCVPSNRQITRVTYECLSGHLCGWSYNPDGRTASHDEYAVWYQLQNGNTRVEWRRYYDSKPVDEIYRVYFVSADKQK